MTTSRHIFCSVPATCYTMNAQRQLPHALRGVYRGHLSDRFVVVLPMNRPELTAVRGSFLTFESLDVRHAAGKIAGRGVSGRPRQPVQSTEIHPTDTATGYVASCVGFHRVDRAARLPSLPAVGQVVDAVPIADLPRRSDSFAPAMPLRHRIQR